MRMLTYNIHGWQGSDGRVDVARLALSSNRARPTLLR